MIFLNKKDSQYDITQQQTFWFWCDNGANHRLSFLHSLSQASRRLLHTKTRNTDSNGMMSDTLNSKSIMTETFTFLK